MSKGNGEQKDIIWAPWRIDYILSEQEEECFFCRAFEAEDENQRKERLLLFQNEKTGILLNKFPYNNGHTLIAPRIHKAELSALGEDVKLDLINQVDRTVQILQKCLDAEGFNIGVNLGETAGAGVPDHIHFHVVPRWEGDTNFMPVTADTKVIPQSLEELFDLLTRELNRD